MKTPQIARSSIALAAFVLACAIATTVNAQSAAAPTFRVGDRWLYDVKSGIGLSSTTYQETREVTAIGAGGIKIKVTGKNAAGADFSRTDDFAGPGVLRSGTVCLDEIRRYPTPLQLLAYPIASGQRSGKWVDAISAGGDKGQINYSYRTHGWEKQTTPAGSYDAIRIDLYITLDDATAFRDATACNFTYWYSPAVRGAVRERRSAQYNELSFGHASIPVLNASYELAGFTPGKP
jgi:hypothetical protein